MFRKNKREIKKQFGEVHVSLFLKRIEKELPIGRNKAVALFLAVQSGQNIVR
jgi:hypothetical protein